MSIYRTGTDDRGVWWSFLGNQGRGTFRCNRPIWLSIASHLSSSRFGEVVEIDDEDGQFLASATIVWADVQTGGSIFELAFQHSEQ